MPQTLPLFLAVVWLSISGSAGAELELIFTSNVTSLEIGASAKLTCQLENFTPGNGDYFVTFYTDNDYFCDYYIWGTKNSQRSLLALHL